MTNQSGFGFRNRNVNAYGFLLAGRTTGSELPGVYAEIESKVRRYITTKSILSAVTGLLVWIVLELFGLQSGNPELVAQGIMAVNAVEERISFILAQEYAAIG